MNCQNCNAPNGMNFIVAHEQRGDGLHVQSYKVLCWTCANTYPHLTRITDEQARWKRNVDEYIKKSAQVIDSLSDEDYQKLCDIAEI